MTTQWTRVLQARGDSPEAKAALSELCAAYYKPVFAFIRRNAPDEDTARDQTHDFFAGILQRHGLNSANPERGKFRSYLLGAVKHFLADAHARATRQKRGGGQKPESLNDTTATSHGAQYADVNATCPDREFDRKWALTLIERALLVIAQEHELVGKERQFKILKPWLTGDSDQISQAEAARQLETNEGAVKVAIHRMRRRFRQAIKDEIAKTVNDPAQIEGELACLLEALR